MLLRRAFIYACASAAAMLALTRPSHAQDAAANWPTKPVTWIVPFAAGGSTDTLAREIASHVSDQLGQSIVINNVSGAGGTVGSARAKQARPDGYTFLVGHMGFMGAAPSLYHTLAYDPVADFDAVLRFPDTPMVLVVRHDAPWQTIADFVADARAHPGKINLANAGVGSAAHLVGTLFTTRAQLDVQHIAYKSVGASMADLVSGRVDAIFDQTNTALPMITSGRTRALVLTTPAPMPQFPGVATLGETLLPGFEAATWYGIYAPKGTPPAIIETLHAAYSRALADKNWTDAMSATGIRVLPADQRTPAALAAHTQAEVQRWAAVLGQAGVAKQ